MLNQLTIQNFGLIDRLSLDFQAGLNILTGSTGAGKSIIIDGLRFALGERLRSTPARDPGQPCIVEAVFEIGDPALRESEVFEDLLADGESTLVLQRRLLPDGKTRVKINGFAATVAQLKQIGDHLIDFHGPHDHQQLLTDSAHRPLLDQLTAFGPLLDEYRRHYQAYCALLQQSGALQDMAASRSRDLDMFTHQIKELEAVPLSQERYEEAEQDVRRLQNVERLHANAAELLEIFDGDEVSLTETLRKAFSPLRSLVQLDPAAAALEDILLQLQDSAETFTAELRDYAGRLDFDPETAEDTERRYDRYEDIRRKYGASLDDVRAYYEEIKRKYDLLVNMEHNTEELQKSIAAAQAGLKAQAAQLTQLRRKTARHLEKTIERELKDLGISDARFEARVTAAADFGPCGRDEVVFYLSPNAGEDLKPLAGIVSSGEAARVMLALKQALIEVDPIPVLIFDEIDAQIGGRLGKVIGTKLQNLSLRRQVLLITHLPQIAAFAGRHFKVEKTVRDGRTLTTVKELNDEDKVREIAEMMAGAEQSDLSLSHAEDMLKKAVSAK